MSLQLGVEVSPSARISTSSAWSLLLNVTRRRFQAAVQNSFTGQSPAEREAKEYNTRSGQSQGQSTETLFFQADQRTLERGFGRELFGGAWSPVRRLPCPSRREELRRALSVAILGYGVPIGVLVLHALG